jgi:hypothetical protein
MLIGPPLRQLACIDLRSRVDWVSWPALVHIKGEIAFCGETTDKGGRAEIGAALLVVAAAGAPTAADGTASSPASGATAGFTTGHYTLGGDDYRLRAPHKPNPA